MNLSSAKIGRLGETRLKTNTYYEGQEKISRLDRSLLRSKYIGCSARKNFTALGVYLGDTLILRLAAKGKSAVRLLKTLDQRL